MMTLGRPSMLVGSRRVQAGWSCRSEKADLPDVGAWSSADMVLSNVAARTAPGAPLGAWEARVHLRRGTDG